MLLLIALVGLCGATSAIAFSGEEEPRNEGPVAIDGTAKTIASGKSPGGVDYRLAAFATERGPCLQLALPDSGEPSLSCGGLAQGRDINVVLHVRDDDVFVVPILGPDVAEIAVEPVERKDGGGTVRLPAGVKAVRGEAYALSGQPFKAAAVVLQRRAGTVEWQSTKAPDPMPVQVRVTALSTDGKVLDEVIAPAAAAPIARTGIEE